LWKRLATFVFETLIKNMIGETFKFMRV